MYISYPYLGVKVDMTICISHHPLLELSCFWLLKDLEFFCHLLWKLIGDITGLCHFSFKLYKTVINNVSHLSSNVNLPLWSWGPILHSFQDVSRVLPMFAVSKLIALQSRSGFHPAFVIRPTHVPISVSTFVMDQHHPLPSRLGNRLITRADHWGTGYPLCWSMRGLVSYWQKLIHSSIHLPSPLDIWNKSQ